MYIKYADYQPDMQLGDDDSVLMSLQEFLAGGKDLEDVPVTIQLQNILCRQWRIISPNLRKSPEQKGMLHIKL